MSGNRHDATREQIVALQTLYAQWEAHTIQTGADSRAARLAWASDCIGRGISSFSELRKDEAESLIDMLKALTGQPVGQRPNPWRPINSREPARAAGTAGRAKGEPEFIQMASADDLARIDEMLRRLRWTREQFEAWLESPRSPLGAAGETSIRTVRQANRVYWALKAMLTRAGGWRASKARSPRKMRVAR